MTMHDTLFCARNDIRQDPVFRAQFHTMCANIGVDPLASNKGMWAQLLGFGDFYYELGVQIVEACLATRAYNGGFMELGALRDAVQVKLGQHQLLHICLLCVCARSSSDIQWFYSIYSKMLLLTV